jgi:hypothetical protein
MITIYIIGEILTRKTEESKSSPLQSIREGSKTVFGDDSRF